MYFYELHPELRIGSKRLSAADLGTSDTSHQTHIGLYDDVLTFLDDTNVVKSAMLIYGDYCDILKCNFDRIENPDGSFRSPKIKTGKNDDSIVAKIREFAKADPYKAWYLVWFGLQSTELVFWLISSGTRDYKEAKHIFIQDWHVIGQKHSLFYEAKEYLEHKINDVSVEIQKDLEVMSQTGIAKRQYRPLDIDKAERIFKTTGFMGEERIAVYLDQQRVAGKISSFEWRNRNGESGDPFDFIINESTTSKQYIDVKTTQFKFDQQVIFSSQEIDFIAKQIKDEDYAVYRAYMIYDESSSFKVCGKCRNYMQELNDEITKMGSIIYSKNAQLMSAKISIKPLSCFQKISLPILLPKYSE